MDSCIFRDRDFGDHIQLILDDRLANMVRIVTTTQYKTKEAKE